MKATGIVRRMDDLGRVVIPKEIRRSLELTDGDPLELFIDTVENALVMKPYYSEASDRLSAIAENLNSMGGCTPEYWEIADELRAVVKKLRKLEERED